MAVARRNGLYTGLTPEDPPLPPIRYGCPFP
jgi:hypothetical protein